MFLFKKISNKYICFGPGMQRLPGDHKTSAMAMKALKGFREAYNRENLPKLSPINNPDTEATAIDLCKGLKPSILEELPSLSIDSPKNTLDTTRIEAMALLEVCDTDTSVVTDKPRKRYKRP